LEITAPAKINLSLEVLGRREDGYHELTTVLHTIDLTDRLTIKASRIITLKQLGPPINEEQNLVFQAANLLQRETGCSSGAIITLEKAIPMASGMGGGSSDAAATLKALNTFWNLKLSVADLTQVATLLGSDVPFFINGGCALIQGRGEIITPLPPMTGWWAVILKKSLPINNKTMKLYGLLTSKDFTDGSTTQILAQGLKEGKASSNLIIHGVNAFERAVNNTCPNINQYRRKLITAGAPFVRLTGSGPTLYTLVKSHQEGEKILDHLAINKQSAFLARLLEPE
jgi:4-diphosphocytidyl-2-C-methyl-D-erythritol kinase